jgi:Ribbon-helix-helix protein, copG family
MRYAVCVKRTTIMLPDDMDARLRLEARRRGSSIADVAREAIDRQLPHPAADGRLSFFSVGEGSPADVSERVDEFVGRAIARRKSGGSTPGRSA